MWGPLQVAVVIPARNEAAALPAVLNSLPAAVDQVIVADNGSSDATAAVARAAGAEVVAVPEPGYGRACLAGARHAQSADVIVFLDGDYSDHAEQMERLLAPLLADRADLVIGSRVRGHAEVGALNWQQRAGNGLACWLIQYYWGHRYTDLGPFRAIRRSALLALPLQELTYGWTVEMQILALTHGLRVCEVPVDYRCRIGHSQISGTLRGSILAGRFILGCIFREAWRGR